MTNPLPDLLVTCFPQRWGESQSRRNAPLNVLDGIIEDINSKTRPPVSGVADLAILIFSRCLGWFDRHQPNDPRYHFMDMFESSIGRLVRAISVSSTKTTLIYLHSPSQSLNSLNLSRNLRLQQLHG